MPISLVLGLIAGQISKKIFDFVWGTVKDEEAPRPKHRYRPPIFEYAHGSNRCAIIGGYVVHAPHLPSLRGRYLYTDNCAGGLRSFVPHRRHGRRDRGLGIHVQDPSSFGEGHGGSLYIASLSGPVYKLVPR